MLTHEQDILFWSQMTQRYTQSGFTLSSCVNVNALEHAFNGSLRNRRLLVRIQPGVMKKPGFYHVKQAFLKTVINH